MGIIPNIASRTASLLGLAAVVIAACGGDGSPAADGDPAGFEVVVTHSILGDIVESAVVQPDGVGISVDVVIPIGADPHNFSPSAKQAESMEDADLLVTNGLGLEAGLSPVIDAVEGSGTPVFVFADHVGLELGPLDEAVAGEESGEDDDQPNSLDPHVWMNPLQVIAGLDALGAELVDRGIDPGEVQPAIAAYTEELLELDRHIEEIVSALPPERRTLVTNHDSFGYFAERYGFEVLGTVIPSLTTSSQTSAAQLEDLADIVRDEGVPAIFVETTESDRLARALAKEAGGDVLVVELYSGSLGEPGSGADTYVGYMTTNAERIVAALG
jgi:zinc/manganese transport system substrate-binding protein